ncbi:Oidioi.mRNA.OKI2018_I69.chr2.g5583.t1.cds [Oikopleura dioica]|uniref:Oidioi.mRNA.OKI2018_I69.chr2.g5583.t1.cds n=1 Tax=Oikopleura dioica TaxID=34765 RepID=A0ABN7T0G3_OIKDI|nr:Oidioi.mRNA.OKI2018_I69.chr2.g5583.t1.cds [Oikopleura dioica]
MYSEWCSLEGDVLGLRNQLSVLNRFPPKVAKEVSDLIVFSIVSSNVDLVTEKEVKFTEEILCYALSLSFTDDKSVQTVKDAVRLYCDWLRVVVDPSERIPLPVRKNPEPHLKKILEHLQNLFVPRVERRWLDVQYNLCKTVLKSVLAVCKETTSLEAATWETILLFFLAIADTLLAPPLATGGLADLLGSELIKTLFEVWLVACAKNFPTPTFWKTLTDFVQGWRHHYAVIDWWSRFTAVLTRDVISSSQGPTYPELLVPEEDKNLIYPMDQETITLAWYQFLRIISNPVELTDTSKFARRDKFVQMAKLNGRNDQMLSTLNHPCLQKLPENFLRLMQGISQLCDGFLGLSNTEEYRRELKFGTISGHSGSIPKPPKSFMGSEMSESIHKTSKGTSGRNSSGNVISEVSSSYLQASLQMRTEFTDTKPRSRPYVNSLLNLFGKWLFDASLGAPADVDTASFSRATSISEPSWHSEMIPSPGLDDSERNEAGRAEALGCLSRILSTIRTNEKIIPAYLARAYLVLSHGLIDESSATRAAILIFGCDFLRVNLPGVTCLYPLFITVLETLIPDGKMSNYQPVVNLADLRFSAVQMLLSMTAFPLHYGNAQISLLPSVDLGNNKESKFVFSDFFNRQAALLFEEINTDLDSTNLQMTIAALHQLLVNTMVKFLAEQNSNEDAQSLSSDSTIRSGDILKENSLDNMASAPGLILATVQKLTAKLDKWASSSNRVLSVVLSVFEVLGALAGYIQEILPPKLCFDQSRLVVKHLCNYIQQSIGRDRREHRRELHSTIVAAFRCVSRWLKLHPELLDDSKFLYYLMEVLELGISGKKSRNSNKVDTAKHEKFSEPVSGRVRHAAEEVLHLIFQRNITDSQVDESVLKTESLEFYYLYGNALVTVAEYPDSESQNPCVVMIVRHPGGRTAWKMEHELTSSANSKPPEIKQLPLDKFEMDPIFYPTSKTVPIGTERIPRVQADFSIPSIEGVAAEEDEIVQDEISSLQEELDRQIEADEAKSTRETSINPCNQPNPVKEFQSARLLFGSLGLLQLDSVKKQASLGDHADLVRLRGGADIIEELHTLDQMPHTHHDTGFVFYVQAGCYQREQIYASTTGRQTKALSKDFIEFLFNLGQPVSVDDHSDWTGNVKTSYRIRKAPKKEKADLSKDQILNGRGIGSLNGENLVLYWADYHNEVAFLVPSPRESSEVSFNLGDDQSEDSKSVASSRKLNPGSCDSRVLIFWLEDWDDIDYIPIDTLTNDATTGEEPAQDVSVIFLHPLRNGLVRVSTRMAQNLKGHPSPLVSGSVVSKSILSLMVRETVINYGNRKRLDSDAHTHASHRRMRKIQEVKDHYQHILKEEKFYSTILSPPSVVQDRRGSLISQASHPHSIDMQVG